MAEFERGSVQANNLLFHYLEMGEGPLALCLHGFPDSPFTYRHLLPELAAAGYRAASRIPGKTRHSHAIGRVAGSGIAGLPARRETR